MVANNSDNSVDYKVQNMRPHLARKNKKLQPNEKTDFIIFSLPRNITCPYSTALCRTQCYVRFEEEMYPQSLKLF